MVREPAGRPRGGFLQAMGSGVWLTGHLFSQLSYLCFMRTRRTPLTRLCRHAAKGRPRCLGPSAGHPLWEEEVESSASCKERCRWQWSEYAARNRTEIAGWSETGHPVSGQAVRSAFLSCCISHLGRTVRGAPQRQGAGIDRRPVGPGPCWVNSVAVVALG